MSEIEPENKLFQYSEEAMATRIEIMIVHSDQTLADGAAAMAFREVDRLEDLLSRFRDGSDVVRISQMKAGETLLLSDVAHECLLQAMEVQMLTNGKFDIATGGFMELLRDRYGNPVNHTEADWAQAQEQRQMGSITIDPNEPRVTCDKEGLSLDLGGIGKGFVLEELTELFEELEIENYLFSAGGSTLLARGVSDKGHPWATRIAGAEEGREVILDNECLSGSGFDVKGAHIVADRSLLENPLWKRIWVKAGHAALADALSTACFLMGKNEIQEVLEPLSGNAQVWVETHEGEIQEV